VRIGHSCAEDGKGEGGREESICVRVAERERGELPRYNIPAYDNITTYFPSAKAVPTAWLRRQQGLDHVGAVTLLCKLGLPFG